MTRRRRTGETIGMIPGRIGMLTPAAPCALDEAEIVVGVEEQLRDREGRPGGLLREEGVDVLMRMPRAGVPVREGGDGDRDLLPAVDPSGARHSGDGRLGVRRALDLGALDELDELGGALEVAEEVVVLGCAGGRISAQCEEARDAGIQELADEASQRPRRSCRRT